MTEVEGFKVPWIYQFRLARGLCRDLRTCGLMGTVGGVSQRLAGGADGAVIEIDARITGQEQQNKEHRKAGRMIKDIAAELGTKR